MAKALPAPAAVNNTGPDGKDKRLNDGHELDLLIKPTGAKWRRIDCSN